MVEDIYVLSINELCLNMGCTSERERQLLNTIMKVEEDEDLHIGWYVFIMNVYLVVLFQSICTWIKRIVNEEAELPHGNESSFHLLEESTEKEIVFKDNEKHSLYFYIVNSK